MKICLAALLALAAAGCSTARVAYDHADIYLKWKASSYLALDDAEAVELGGRVDEFLAWHRARALPQYAALADETARRLARGLSQEDLVWGYDAALVQARESARAAAERIAPLLDRLTSAQAAYLERRFADDNRRFARKYLRGGEGERRRLRVERNVERLEEWVGELSGEQVRRVARYSERAPLLEDLRARDHLRLQGELLALVRAHAARARLAEAASHWERGREPAYAAAYEASRAEYFAMLLDIDRSLTREQRGRAVRRLRGWADEFRALAER
ncbi:MAG TPA: DUF6279 family lipoprotein [Burkholderiales bacterium]|nr:DUF6279 family lipoprotein [Burkholderiales bacterium]